jgi:hypothetical protein
MPSNCSKIRQERAERRATPPQPFRISAKTFFGAIFGPACGVQLWAGARPAKPGCHSNPGIRVFSRDPGLATAQKSVRREQSYATAAISAKTFFGAIFGSSEARLPFKPGNRSVFS